MTGALQPLARFQPRPAWLRSPAPQRPPAGPESQRRWHRACWSAPAMPVRPWRRCRPGPAPRPRPVQRFPPPRCSPPRPAQATAAAARTGFPASEAVGSTSSSKSNSGCERVGCADAAEAAPAPLSRFGSAPSASSPSSASSWSSPRLSLPAVFSAPPRRRRRPPRRPRRRRVAPSPFCSPWVSATASSPVTATASASLPALAAVSANAAASAGAAAAGATGATGAVASCAVTALVAMVVAATAAAAVTLSPVLDAAALRLLGRLVTFLLLARLLGLLQLRLLVLVLALPAGRCAACSAAAAPSACPAAAAAGHCRYGRPCAAHRGPCGCRRPSAAARCRCRHCHACRRDGPCGPCCDPVAVLAAAVLLLAGGRSHRCRRGAGSPPNTRLSQPITPPLGRVPPVRRRPEPELPCRFNLLAHRGGRGVLDL